ncbi:MAG: linear amide C-N hydrolase [Candidatus Berkiella sp.]
MNNNRLPLQLAFIFILFSFMNSVNACTSVRIKAKDTDVIYGRTMEFAQDLQSSIIYVPEGVTYQGTTAPGVTDGKKWQVKYPFTGVSAYHLPHAVDGVNTQGLAVGILFFPNYAQYPVPTPTNKPIGIAPWELGTYLLSNFATIAQVIEGLKSVVVLGVPLTKDGSIPQYHYTVHDAKGNSLVIEYVGGELTTFENHLGVLTNSPTFDWHVTNLRNYVNLTVNNVPPINISGTELIGFGQGTGLLGLPGDFTPPSRFVRAVAFTQSSVPSMTGYDAIFHVFHIMNQFDIPKGAVRSKEGTNTLMEYTQWTTASNLKDKTYFYRTYLHSQIHKIDLTKMSPKIKKIQWYPMSKDVNYFKEVTEFSDSIKG